MYTNSITQGLLQLPGAGVRRGGVVRRAGEVREALPVRRGEEGKNKMTGSSGGSACRLLIDEGEGRGEWFRAVTRAGGACVPLPGPRSTYVLSQGAKPWRTRHPFRIGILLGTSLKLFVVKLLCFRHNE